MKDQMTPQTRKPEYLYEHHWNPQVQHKAQAQAPAAVPALPFTSGAHENVQPAFSFSVVPGAAAQAINPIDIPAAGYFRYVFLEITATGGTGGTIAADGPWNLFKEVNLHDVNGGKMFGPMDGYAAFIANLLGGYSSRHNPADSPWYVGTAPNPSFYLRIPVEVARKNGFGSLANQSTASEYKLDLTINSLAAMFSVAPSPVPTYTVKGWLEAWTLPAVQNSKGQLQSQVPPLLGSAQMWTSSVQSAIGAGDNTIRMKRLGNYIRLLAFIARDNSGVRSDAVFPDPFTWEWDGTVIRKESQKYSRQEVYEKLHGASASLPTGVFCIPFNHGGNSGVTSMGNEDSDLWIPASGTARIEVNGPSAAAGSVQVLTNDITVAEQNYAERFQTPNDTGTQVVA